MVAVTVAASTLLDGGDLGIQAFGNGVGNAMREVSQNVGQVARDELGNRDDRRQAAVSGPEVPASPEAPCPACSLVVPELTQRLLERPRPRGLQLHRLDVLKVLPGALGDVLGAVEPQVFRLGKARVALLEQCTVLVLAYLVHGLEHMAHE